MTKYADLANLKEDERIEMIGKHVMTHRHISGFMVEDMPKAEKYINKLKGQFPGIQILSKSYMNLTRMVLVKLGPPAEA